MMRMIKTQTWGSIKYWSFSGSKWVIELMWIMKGKEVARTSLGLGQSYAPACRIGGNVRYQFALLVKFQNNHLLHVGLLQVFDEIW